MSVGLMNILSWFAGYTGTLLVIAAIAGLGIFIGISLRKKKNAEEAATEAENTSENS